MKIRLLLAFLGFAIFTSSVAHASPFSQDTGKIKTLFVSAGGSVAIILDNGFANAIAGNQCSTANGFAGFANAGLL